MSSERRDVVPLSAADADPELMELLDAGRSELPTPEQLDALAASIGPFAGPPSAPPSPVAATGASVAGASTGLKIVAAIVIAGGVGIGAWWAWPANEGTAERQSSRVETPAAREVRRRAADPRSGPDSPPAALARVAAPAPPGEAGAAPRDEASPAAELPRAAASSARVAPSGSRAVGGHEASGGLVASPPAITPGAGVPPSSSPVPTELELLDRAQSTLRSNPAAALDALDRHATVHPYGVLEQEREVLAIEALYRLGRGEEAGRRADRFEARWPRSAQIRRVRVLRGTHGGGAPPQKS
jgi:hypothetical protein